MCRNQKGKHERLANPHSLLAPATNVHRRISIATHGLCLIWADAGTAVAAAAAIGGPANVQRHWCQFKRIRGDRKERTLYTSKNGSLETVSWYTKWTKSYNLFAFFFFPAGWWNNSSLEASDLSAYVPLSWFFIPPLTPPHLEKEHMDFVERLLWNV